VHLLDGKPVYSAGDLVGFLACEHLTDLERAALAGATTRPIRDDPEIELIRKRGFEHERWYITQLEAERRTVTRIEPDTSADQPDGQPMSHADEFREQLRLTRSAIERGDDVIYQAALFDGTWRGHADFLLRVDGPNAGSELGDFHYEIADTKLARSTKASALLQLCTYVDLLTLIQGRPPEWVHVALGGSAKPIEHHRVADYFAYYRALKARFETTVRSDTRPADYPPSASSPEPVEHCDVCRWQMICNAWWRDHDSLKLVAGVTRNQRRALTERGVDTRRRLAVLPIPVDPPLRRTSRESIVRVREQARIQVAGLDEGRMLYELLEPERGPDRTILPGRGLAALPPPSPGDLFFDIEGDPFAFEDGLEYLFGIVEYDGAGWPAYHRWWAVDRDQEKVAFEQLIDFIVERRVSDPALHVYHYGSYERGRAASLSTRHATREERVDELLRGSVFVDLLTATKAALRASVEGYSIKNLEPLYSYTRQVDLRLAGDSIVQFERYLEEGGSDQSILERIADYNRDDCESAAGLRNWLEARRPEAESLFGGPMPRPIPTDSQATPEQTATRQAVQALASRLTADLPSDPASRTPVQAATQLLADLLDWHWREEKSTWWQFFDLITRPDEELIVAREPIAGLKYIGPVQLTGRQKHPVYRYTFPPQENDVKGGSAVYDPRLLGVEGMGIGRAGSIAAIDQVEGWLELKRPPDHPAGHPTALVPHDQPGSDAQRESLLEIGRWMADNGAEGPGPYRAARDLLLRRPPRVGIAEGASLAADGEPGATAAFRLVTSLDETTLPIQGPPGSGKSTTGADMIVKLVAAGRKVGITANSHKVIANMLKKVIARGSEKGMEIQTVQKITDDEDALVNDLVKPEKDTAKVRRALDEDKAMVAAGTAWLWSSEQMRGAVDVLFVDEAGQMSLANAVAVSTGARNLVLLGDPQQLDQPTQGTHPDGAGVSALEHVLAGEPTIDPRRGLFLESTWRLHPQICEFTSDQFYAGQLTARPGTGRQQVGAAFEAQGLFGSGARELPVEGSGLRFVPVAHQDNSSRSGEEASVVAQLAQALVGAAEWTDSSGRHHQVRWDDLLVVAPYNAQVRAIRDLLPAAGKGRVGTVDKFQGQEAAVSIYSMTTSSADEAPHGLNFLYSRNRLNVATSRARCLAIVVANPELTNVRCRSAKQVKLVNALCRFIELAIEVRVPQAQAPLDLVPA
jgi:predicted RecB family nuclease